jgi:tetratricopeptide (TPR) repeat protein
VILDLLERMSYVNAVLWIGARLADGLAHAHERGILHRDLKPGNILLTDEGQPMLLDFNLSEDTKLTGLAEAARLGGTLPYMAPEHLQSFTGMRRVVDARADVYALGVILYELLTGRQPFPHYSRGGQEVLLKMLSDRHTVPHLRSRNAEVTPAVESLVRKCLAFDPKDRYQSARELMEDLDRHLHHCPLKHAANPSIRERLRKWCRRHPRLSSASALGTCAAVLLVAAVGFAGYQHQRRLGLEARESLGQFRDDAKRFQLSLTGLPEDDRRPLVEAAAAGRSALSRYPSPGDPEWERAQLVRHLGDSDRGELRVESGTLLLMLAHATARAADTDDEVREALQLNEQAEAAFSSSAAPPALWSQRADLLERLGRGEEAAAYRAKASAPAASARDHYLAGWEYARHGRYAAAVPLLEQATRLDPKALWAWFLLGRSYDGLGRDADAVACYGTCLALQPDAHQVWFNRGLAYLRRGDFKNARADLDRALELKPTLADAYFNRGLARRALNDLPGAEDDFTRALENGAHYTRVYFVRAQVRAQRGDAAGAESDRREGLSREPVEESCWTARGFAKLGSDPKGALADFDRALERNPQYRPALMNKAHVLGEVMHDAGGAVAVLDQAIRFHPDQATFWATRAVYHARLGRRTEAHRDAEEALQLGHDPATRYQVAGVYALTSKEHADDRKEAFRLLASALRRDYGFEYLDIDPELAPIRDLPEFKNLVAAARALKNPTPK